MKIGVVGAGAIGCYVGGALRTAGAADIVLVGRSRIGDELAAHGLSVQDFAGERRRADGVPFSTAPAVLATCDAVLCCVKSGQTDEVARSLAGVLRADAIVVSLQNGVRNADVLRARLPSARVLAGIVGFNVRSHGEGVFQRTTSGAVMLEPGADALVTALRAAGIDTQPRADLVRHQWTKLLVNLNNAVSALSGAPTRELMLSRGLRRVIASIVDEALGVLRAAKLRPAPLRGVPVRIVPFMLRLPTPIVRIALRSQLQVDPEARSSMWEDLARRRPTEVDYLNGEIVRLAEQHGVEAPRNRRIVELVHAAERTGSPGMSGEALAAALG